MPTPKLAAWLLRTLGSGDSTEGLLGDLVEECEGGRSRGWFWWQALAGIVVTFVNEVRAHKILTLRAAILGYVAFRAAQRLLWTTMPLMQVLTELYVPRPSDHYMATAYRMVDGVRVIEPIQIPLPWQAAVVDPLLALLLLVIAAVVTGWIVGQLHRRYRGPAIFVTAVLLTALVWPRHWYVPPDGERGLEVPYETVKAIWPLMTFVGVAVGGRFARRRRQTVAV